MLHIKKFVFFYFQENTYVVWDDSMRCAIIDPGCYRASEIALLHGFIAGQGLTPEVILLTHGHLDHIFGVRDCAQRYGIPVMMHPEEKKTLELFNAKFAGAGIVPPDPFEWEDIEDGGTLRFGDTSLAVIHTPGHSPGSVCFHFGQDGVIFTGDTLFAGCIGRTDTECASLDDILDSLRNRLMTLDSDLRVYPGHGTETSIGRERATNPFIYEDLTMQDILGPSDNFTDE